MRKNQLVGMMMMILLLVSGCSVSDEKKIEKIENLIKDQNYTEAIERLEGLEIKDMDLEHDKTRLLIQAYLGKENGKKANSFFEDLCSTYESAKEKEQKELKKVIEEILELFEEAEIELDDWYNDFAAEQGWMGDTQNEEDQLVEETESLEVEAVEEVQQDLVQEPSEDMVLNVAIIRPYEDYIVDYMDDMEEGIRFAQANYDGETGITVHFFNFTETEDLIETEELKSFLMNNEIQVILGPVYTNNVYIVDEVCEELELLYILPVTNNDEFSSGLSYGFSLNNTTSMMASIMGEYLAKELGITKVGVLMEEGDEAAQASGYGFINSFALGSNYLYYPIFLQAEQVELGESMLNLYENGVEALFFANYTEQAPALEEAKQLGMDIIVVSNNSYVLEEVEGYEYYYPVEYTELYPAEVNEQYLGLLEQQEDVGFGIVLHAHGYDAMNIVLEAAQKSQSTEPFWLYNYLYSNLEAPYEGVTGTIYEFDIGEYLYKEISIVKQYQGNTEYMGSFIFEE